MLASTSDQREPSPVREVSPKFVYGQKKYGRRSRPQSIDQDNIPISDSDCESLILISDNDTNGDILVERLNEEDLKRQMGSKSGISLLEKDYLGGETELRAAWERLGLGNDLRPNELATLYSAIGMDNVADQVVSQVFSTLNRRQEDGKVRFDELIDLLRCRLSSANSSPQHSNLMSLLEAVSEERDKLRNDLADANHRAQVLAQEIDERHVRIEKATRNKVKLLEQKHQEEIKELKKELSLEREHLTSANQRLEAKLSQHVEQISKLNAKIASLKKNIENVEKENTALGERLSQSQSMNDHLHKQLGALPALQIRVAELEGNEEETTALRERIEELQIENKILKDSTDELKTQLESLAFQKREVSWDNGNGGMKRRGAEDSKESRLGKVRKCSGENDFFPFPTYYFDQDASIDEIEVCPISRTSSTFISLDNELGHLNPSSEPCSDDIKWIARNEEKHFADAGAQCDDVNELQLEEISKTLSQASCTDKNCSFRILISSFLQGTSKALSPEDFEKLSQFAFEFVEDTPNVRDIETQTQSEPKIEDMEENICIENVKGDENCPQCRKLEASLELLRVEYERTEDYWACKLEEERTIFEMDQQESDERFSELERKIEEYDQLLSSEKMKSKLPTIDEKDFLEKQVTDLEEEHKNFRKEMELELCAKESLIANLEESLSKLSSKTLANVEVQTEETSEKKISGHCYCACHDLEKKESRRERDLRTKLKFDYEDLLQENFRLLNTIRSLQTSSQANARIIENLKCRVRDQEHENRGLEAQIKSQHKVTERLLQDAWEKHKMEQRTLRDRLRNAEERLDRAESLNKIQLSKLADADEVVKTLFVEKSNLTFALAKVQEKSTDQLYNSF